MDVAPLRNGRNELQSSMQNSLVVNAEGPEIRVAVVENGSLAELFVERKRERGIVGNIYRGKVTRVLPGMQAAFVDLGPKVERAAFLYVADVLGSGDERKLFEDSEMDDTGDESPEGAASRLARSRKQLAARKIENLLKPGQDVIVQVVKDPIGLKGARVTGYISLPGRYSVFMPHVAQVGVSRRIGSDKERRRLRDLVNEVRPKGSGFIVRTAAEDANDQELRDDVDFLARLWGEIERREEDQRGPGLVYADLDLSLRVIRDLMREDTSEVLIDDEEQCERVKKFTMAFLPRFTERIKRYEGRRPIFDHHHIEPAIRQAVARKVPLRSGGSLVIDQGEALTAIDINTGSFTNTGSGNLEDTVTANNLEACEEVARQLRLRNIGGIIVIDFVDMDKENNRRKVWDAFQKALSRDRARTNVTKISELGLVEMTRKRTARVARAAADRTVPDLRGRRRREVGDHRRVRDRAGSAPLGLVGGQRAHRSRVLAARRGGAVAPGARLPRQPREALPEEDRGRAAEGLEARPVPGRRQDVDGDRGGGRGGCPGSPGPAGHDGGRPRTASGARRRRRRRWWRSRRAASASRWSGPRARHTWRGVSHRIRIARAEHKFSVAHMTVFPDGTKERLHGHNYTIAVELDVGSIAFQSMIPFASIKHAIGELCAAWKERVLIARDNRFLAITRDDLELELTLCGERYVFPRGDVLLLPLDNISVEALADHLATLLRDRLSLDPANVRSLAVTVEESPGQGSTTTLLLA